MRRRADDHDEQAPRGEEADRERGEQLEQEDESPRDRVGTGRRAAVRRIRERIERESRDVAIERGEREEEHRLHDDRQR